MKSEEPLLKIVNLHAGIEDTKILKGINIEIGAGEIHAIMGRNGSGKTTTANIIMGHPDFDIEKGAVSLNDIEYPLFSTISPPLPFTAGQRVLLTFYARGHYRICFMSAG